MSMSLNAISSIANLLAAIGVLITSIYLSRPGRRHQQKDVYEAYHEVIALHLGIARTRTWWQTVGRIGFNAAFVAEVDRFLATRPTTTYFEEIRRFDAPPARSDAHAA